MKKTIIISDTHQKGEVQILKQHESRAQGITDVAESCQDCLKYHYKDSAIPNSFKSFGMYPYVLSNVDASPTSLSFVNDDVKMLVSSTKVIENNSSLEQSSTEVFETSHEETCSSSTTSGYSIGAGIKSTTKATVKVDFLLAGAEVEQSMELSFTSEYNHSSTETKSTTNKKSWRLEQPVKAAPYTKIVCTQYVLGGIVNVPVKLNATLRGDYTFPLSNDYLLANIKYSPKNGSGDTTATMSASALGLDWPGKPSGVFNYAGDPNSIDLVGVGKSSVTAGYYTYVKFEEYPLYAKSASPTKVYYSDIMLADRTAIPNSEKFLIK